VSPARAALHVLGHSIAVRAAGDYQQAQFYDMYFQDFVTDQLAVVEKIDDSFELEPEPL
jgi:hypothetical protein